MLSRTEMKSIQAQKSYPSISILAPTHRTAPLNKKDPIKVKNLVSKAIDRLHGEFKKREVAGVVDKLKNLVKQLDWQHTLDGLALFANQDFSASVNMPFRVKPRVVIDETFATRDLVYSFNRAPRYRVLSLGHTPRLFDAWTTVLEEHLAKPFPMEHRGPGGAGRLSGGKGINISKMRDDAVREFFRTVDSAVADVQKESPRPLVIVGELRTLAFYREVTRQSETIVGMLAGNHERTEPSALGKLVWPVFEAGATVRRTDALVQLDEAVNSQRHAAGIDDVWNKAVDGKIQSLFVEKDYKHPADVNPEGDKLLPYTGKGAQALDDAVDETIERVMDTGGEVFFYATDDLDGHQQIAAVLRR